MLQVIPGAIGIQTRYLGATNSRGARIKAFTLDNNPITEKPDNVTVPYNYEFNSAEAHKPAMVELHNKLSHNPEVTAWHEKECDHIAVSSGTEKGYIYIFKNKE